MNFKVKNTRTNVTHEIEAEDNDELYLNAMVEFVGDPEDEEGIEKFTIDWATNMSVEEIEIADHLNPDFLFSDADLRLLVAIVGGSIDAKELAMKELRNRGLDASGKWVGFSNTKKP